MRKRQGFVTTEEEDEGKGNGEGEPLVEHMKMSFCSCGWNIILDVPYQENREQNNRYQILFEGLAIIIILTALTYLSLYFNVVTQRQR